MVFVARVVFFDFSPESWGMVRMVDVGQFMDNDVILELLWDLHEANIKRDSNSVVSVMVGTAAPASTGVGKFELIIMVIV